MHDDSENVYQNISLWRRFEVCRDVQYQWLNISRMIKLLKDANLSKDNKNDKDIKECEITCFN